MSRKRRKSFVGHLVQSFFSHFLMSEFFNSHRRLHSKPGHGEALKKTGAQYANDLGTELKNATDEYARAVRELSSKLRTKAAVWRLIATEDLRED